MSNRIAIVRIRDKVKIKVGTRSKTNTRERAAELGHHLKIMSDGSSRWRYGKETRNGF